MLRLTGTYADGWLPLPSSVDRYRERFETIAAAAAAAGRPTPVASLVPATILGYSRAQVLQTLEEVPAARLIAYYLPAATWRAYGVEHPGGPDCRGQADIIPHTIEAERLIEIAEKIPVELVEELAWFGNAEEIAERIAPYAAAGATHLMLGDVTGTTYAPQEAARVIGEQLPRLKTLLAQL
jgi:phthiodiolone/phenolphthiodiolone dimycocerosates ketoreductase